MKKDLAITISAAALVALGGSVAAVALTTGGAHKASSPAARQVDQQTTPAPTSAALTQSAATSRPAATRTHTVVTLKRSTRTKHHAVSSTRIVHAKEPAVTDPTSTEPAADPTSTRPAEPADTASGTEITVKLGPGTSEGPGVWRAPTGPKLSSQPPHSNPPQLPNPNSPSPTPTPTP